MPAPIYVLQAWFRFQEGVTPGCEVQGREGGGGAPGVGKTEFI